jgi:hypothetical protein
MLPCKPAEQNRDAIAFLGCKRPLNRTVKMCWLVQTSDLAEPIALGLQALLDFFIIVDLHKVGRHYLPPAYAVLKCLLESLDKKKVAFDVTAEIGEVELEAEEWGRRVPAVG